MSVSFSASSAVNFHDRNITKRRHISVSAFAAEWYKHREGDRETLLRCLTLPFTFKRSHDVIVFHTAVSWYLTSGYKTLISQLLKTVKYF